MHKYLVLVNAFTALKKKYQGIAFPIQYHSNLERNITNIILVDASESLNGSRVEAYAKRDIRMNVIFPILLNSASML